MTAMTREQSDAWIMARIPQLSPETAEYVIKQAETARLRWSPAVMKALLVQAGKRPAETEEPPEPVELKLKAGLESIGDIPF